MIQRRTNNRRTSGFRRLLALVGMVSGTLLMATAAAQASEWQTGDLFLGVSNGNYQVRAPNGTLKETLNGGSGFTTGCALDSSGNLYGTFFSNNRVVKFASAHPHAATFFGDNAWSTPEDIHFDAAGNVYVGSIGNGIRQYAANGTFIKQLLPGVRVDFFDIAADQDTIRYGQEGQDVKQVSISSGLPLPNFTTGTATQAFAMRILADGGLLLADLLNVKRYNAAGVVTQTYDVTGEDSWFALNLDPNGTSFWSGNINTANYYKINIGLGTVEAGPFNTGTGSNTLFGICLKGEITVAQPDRTKPTCILRVENGPPKRVIVTVEDDGSGIASIVVTKSANSDTVVPPFTPGTTDPVVVTSTKIDQSKSSQVEIRVTDVAGNVLVCDPVLTMVTRNEDQPETQTFVGLPRAESKITLTNGTPGVKTLLVVVNGVKFKVKKLKDGEKARLDVSSAMKSGSNNTIELTAKGKKHGTMDVVIADVWIE